MMVAVANEERENGGGFVGGNGMEIGEFGKMGPSGDGDFTGIDGGENKVLGLGFEYDVEEGEGNYNGNDQVREEGDDGLLKGKRRGIVGGNGMGDWGVGKWVHLGMGISQELMGENKVLGSGIERVEFEKKRKVLKGLEKKGFGFLVNQLGQLRELEARESMSGKLWRGKVKRKKEERQRINEWEAMERESEERKKKKRRGSIQEIEREERLNRKKSEWKKRMDETLNQHRAEMNQMQTHFLHEQQNLTSQMLGIVSQWTGHPTALSDHAASNHYLSQMMQNLHHVNGMIHGDDRVDGDNQDDRFIVDG
ncbi:inorganic phosphate transporter family protein [Hibiscus syriacus]|uniref:Inorganic phosphate transporter family protein n=1 Tax=Hibiscus syriacus TaxID=106335 RepID=A0A6A3CE12_HIBSY|nr:inorganic phosphate transporter family protein [Hibiscus syriacus]